MNRHIYNKKHGIWMLRPGKATKSDPSSASPTPSPTIAELVRSLDRSPQEFWEGVVNTMHEGLLLVDPDQRILYLNAKAEELVGRTLEEVQGLPCTEAINCPQCAYRCRLFEDGDVEGLSVNIQPQGSRQSRVLRKNARLLKDEHGEVVGGVETFKDITQEVQQRQENERSTAALAAEKNRNEALLGSLRDGVFSIDSEFRIRSFSPRMAELCELGAAEALGRQFFELLGLRNPYGEVHTAADLDGRSCRVELRTGRGVPLPAELSFRKIRVTEDEVLGVLRPLTAETPDGEHVRPGTTFQGIVSSAPAMHEIFRLLQSAAASTTNILVEGESGTGKELVARAIHSLSPRRGDPFYAVNCATFTGSLLLSELFGHERGAFTGAFRTTQGKLEMAGAGTLFLDEVSEIPLHYQGVLLRVLEDREFERVGGQSKIELKARIISATNERLLEAVRDGRFREDLYYRLKVVPILMPALRDRREDVPLLAGYFANHPAINLAGRPVRFTAEAMEILTHYGWPGNVRELRNLVEYLCFVSDDVIDVDHLPPELQTQIDGTAGPGVDPLPPSSSAAAARGEGRSPSSAGRPEPRLLNDGDERQRILHALEQARFRRSKAAELLGIDRTTLWRRMKKLGIALD